MSKRKFPLPELPLMPAPNATVKEPEPEMVCGFCGGKEPAGDKKPVFVNGIRINPKHKTCIKSAKRPLFDMDSLVER